MKVLANGLARAILNAPAPRRAGQRYEIILRREMALNGEMVDHQYTLISSEFQRDGNRWFDWTVDL